MADKIKAGVVFLAALICFLSFSSVSSAEILFGESYYRQLHKYLQEANDSVTVAMYFIIIGEGDDSHPINILVDDLIAARDRGVRVNVVLEDSKFRENRLAYRRLRDNDVAVYFDSPHHLLHIKGVAIDDRYIFIGSANWSRAAVEDNYEATYVADSPGAASAFKKYVENIPVEKDEFFLPETEGTTILSSFILSPGLGRELLKARADRQFDLYLLLCKKQAETGKSYFKVDYDGLAKEMDYMAPDDLGKYRDDHHYYYERIHRLLIPLKIYGLIDYQKAKVTLKANAGNDESGPKIVIPYEFWEGGYFDRVSMRAKYMYLICLYESARSTRYPLWFRSQKDMSGLYGISDTTISLGLQELEDEGMIEIIRDQPAPPDFSDRKANIYKMLPLSK